jgi:hypothetical protein
VLALLVLLAVVQACGAADLKAGWYARIRTVEVLGRTTSGDYYIKTRGWFNTIPGTYGPFTVSDLLALV